MSPRLFLFAMLFGITLGVMLTSSKAMAAKPTKKECAAANETAQDLRTAGRLREARASLAICTAAGCPGAIREDCAQRLKEVEAAIPTVVFVVRDPSGKDLSDVRVAMDGAPLLEKLDGAAVMIDPGEHRFTFESEGLHTGETTVIVREGDSNRQVRVVLKPLVSPEASEAPAAPAPTGHARESAEAADGSTRRSLGLSLGAAGAAGIVLGAVFAIVSKSTYDHALHDECGNNPRGGCSALGVRDGQSAQSQATVATVGFVGGAALVGAGALLYFTAPKSDDVAVSATVSSTGGAISLRGRW